MTRLNAMHMGVFVLLVTGNNHQSTGSNRILFANNSQSCRQKFDTGMQFGELKILKISQLRYQLKYLFGKFDPASLIFAVALANQ